ncbi:anthranilate synthase component I [candidate division KSB1 bacterium]|nr:anthranilate synthase component I [candidate division KSB1 bacterium]
MQHEIPKLNVKSMHHKISVDVSPLTVFEKLYYNTEHGFLYESLESVEKRGRYSFLGGEPYAVVKSRRGKTEVRVHDETLIVESDPLVLLKEMVDSTPDWPPVASFSGGAVGYMAYDAIRLVEEIPDENPDNLNVPDLYFMFPSEMLVFDHLDKTVELVVFAEDNPHEKLLVLQTKIRNLIEEPLGHMPQGSGTKVELTSNTTKEAYCEMVEKAKEYILAGDVFQVVLSQRFQFPMPTTPLNAYKALRMTNPSPYMYHLKLNGFDVLGSSPEILVKLDKEQVTIRPLAGTRRRGKTPDEDRAFEAELLKDEKERAEHVMLVDLARNDIGQVCDAGSVHPTDLIYIEKYTKVMHIVSNVVGKLRKNCDAFDLIRATFPAGTVSGAPKIRSMEIIDELEVVRRGVYAGAIGYFGFNGSMDMCIAIRMMLVKDEIGYLQAGAGIVADSVPDLEYEETCNKARALMHAIEMIGGQ